MDDKKSVGGLTWHRIMWLAPMIMAAIFLVVMVTLAGGFEPFLFIFGVVLVATGLVGRRFPRRAGPITVLVVLLALVLTNLQTLIEDMAHPDSFMNFAVFGVWLFVLALSGIVASVATLLRRSDGTARPAAYTVVGLIVVSAVVSGIATMSLEDDTVEAGDLTLTVKDVEFSTDALEGAGTVGIFIENKDPFRHTFTIEALDVDVELPASTNRRVDITAASGSYEYMCSVPGHEDMKGTLTIAG